MAYSKSANYASYDKIYEKRFKRNKMIRELLIFNLFRYNATQIYEEIIYFILLDYPSFTCVSVRCREAASPALSELER